MTNAYTRTAIVDLTVPGMGGLELIARLRTEFPALRVLALSMHADEQYALRAFQAGAHGYVTNDRAPAELVNAVTKVAGGGAYVSASLAERMVQQLSGAHAAPRHAALSNRELEALRRICNGQRLSEIAQALHLSIKTVSTHKRHGQDAHQGARAGPTCQASTGRPAVLTGRCAGQAATGYALRGLPRAASTTTTGEPRTANTLDLSTARLARDGLPPLVNVQSARVVKIRSARTTHHRRHTDSAVQDRFAGRLQAPGSRSKCYES
jgi:FixJ family two-component response regulator